MFSKLPPEILLHLCNLIPLETILSLGSLNSSYKEFFQVNSESCYRSIAFQQYSTPQSSSSASSLIPFELNSISTLQDFIAQQYVLNDAYADVNTWEKFVRKRVLLSQNWSQGQSTLKVTPLTLQEPSTLDPLSLWRFKLAGQEIIATGINGGICTFGLDGMINEECGMNSEGMFAHVEWTEGYTILSKTTLLFDVFYNPNFLSNDSTYTHLATLISPAICRATKARYPYFFAYSAMEEKVYIYDLRLISSTSEPMEPNVTISVLAKSLERGFLTYIDFDEEYVYLAGTDQVQKWNWRDSSEFDSTLPHTSTEDVEWVGVHHWNGMIVSMNMASQLIIQLPNGDTFCFMIRGLVQFEHLSVENGKIIFSATELDSGIMSLILLDFTKSTIPPIPICLLFLVPVLGSISRLEMNSNQIFCLVNGNYYRSTEYKRKMESAETSLSYSWSILAGYSWKKDTISKLQLKSPIKELEDGFGTVEEYEIGEDGDVYDTLLTLTF